MDRLKRVARVTKVMKVTKGMATVTRTLGEHATLGVIFDYLVHQVIKF